MFNLNFKKIVGHPTTTSDFGKFFIKDLEGFKVRSYRDSAGVWTIGYGFTNGVRSNQTITKEESDVRFDFEIKQYERVIVDLEQDGVFLNQDQFDALVSFAYNVGTGAFKRSTLYRKLKSNDFDGISSEFLRWVYAGGKSIRGLLIRRKLENMLFMGKLLKEKDKYEVVVRGVRNSTLV